MAVMDKSQPSPGTLHSCSGCQNIPYPPIVFPCQHISCLGCAYASSWGGVRKSHCPYGCPNGVLELSGNVERDRNHTLSSILEHMYGEEFVQRHKQTDNFTQAIENAAAMQASLFKEIHKTAIELLQLYVGRIRWLLLLTIFYMILLPVVRCLKPVGESAEWHYNIMFAITVAVTLFMLCLSYRDIRRARHVLDREAEVMSSLPP